MDNNRKYQLSARRINMKKYIKERIHDFIGKLNQNRNTIMVKAIALLVATLITLFVAIRTINFYLPKMEDGEITRNISDILNHLPDIPEDMDIRPYEAGLPLFVRLDIMRIQENYNRGQESRVIYQSEDGLNYLEIYIFDNMVKFSVTSKNRAYVGEGYTGIEANVSIYKKGETLAIYGRNNIHSGNIVYCIVGQENIQLGNLYHQGIKNTDTPNERGNE